MTRRMKEAIAASGRFRDIRTVHYRWRASYSPEEDVDLIDTYSDHQTLTSRVKKALYPAIAAAIDSSGSRLKIRYRTTLFLAREKTGS